MPIWTHCIIDCRGCAKVISLTFLWRVWFVNLIVLLLLASSNFYYMQVLFCYFFQLACLECVFCSCFKRMCKLMVAYLRLISYCFHLREYLYTLYTLFLSPQAIASSSIKITTCSVLAVLLFTDIGLVRAHILLAVCLSTFSFVTIHTSNKSFTLYIYAIRCK